MANNTFTPVKLKGDDGSSFDDKTKIKKNSSTMTPKDDQTPINIDQQGDTFSKGQVSSRTNILLGHVKTEAGDEKYAPIGGLSQIQFNIGAQNIPLQEVGSDIIAIKRGRPQPFNLSVSKQYINGRSLIPSLFPGISFSGDGDGKSKDILEPNASAYSSELKFVMNPNKTELKKTRNLALGVWNPNENNLNAVSLNTSKLKGVLVNQYSLNINTDSTIISETVSMIGENVDDADVSIYDNSNTNSDLSDGNKFVNELDFKDPNSAEEFSAMEMVIAMKVDGGYIPIGGLRNLSLSQNIPVQVSTEIGSNKNYLIVGRPGPANIMLQKGFINQKNLLSALSYSKSGEYNAEDETEKPSTEFQIGISRKALGEIHNFAIMLYNRESASADLTLKQVFEIEQARIQNYTFSSGGGIILNENASMIGRLGNEMIV